MVVICVIVMVISAKPTLEEMMECRWWHVYFTTYRQTRHGLLCASRTVT